MRILLHNPVPDSIYAGRTIFFGYKHAFEDLKHEVKVLTPDSDQKNLFDEFKPEIFITALSVINLKYLDLDLLKKHKKRGMKVFANMSFWTSPLSKLRVNENPSLSEKKDWIKLVRSGNFADIYYNVCEQGDYRMKGFQKATGYKHHTMLLAADKTMPIPKPTRKYACDFSFIGTLLPEKKKFIKDYIFPLMKKYDVDLYGQDWTVWDKTKSWIQRGGQYFNIPYLKSLRKPQLNQMEELQVHRSSKIALNVHETYQKIRPGDINERTYKIIYAGGFQLIDNVPSLKRHFKIDKEIVVGHNTADWFDKIEFYIKNPKARQKIIDAGRKRILKDHTYHNRVKQIIKLYKSIS